MNFKNPLATKYIFLILALIISLFPFIYLAQYNHPAADDFCYSSKSTYLGFMVTQIDHWLTWSGRYTATALLSFFTVDLNDLSWYRIFPVFLFIIFGISVFVFLKSLFNKASTYDICALSFVIFFLYLLKAPNITEAFYWFAGSTTYQIASILSLFLFSIVLHLLRHRKKSTRIILTIIASILGIVIVGLNEISLIYLCISLFIAIVFRFYLTRRLEWDFITIVALTGIAAIISLTAPGNYMRMSTIMVAQYNFHFSSTVSTHFALSAIKGWLPLLILLVIIFWGTFKRLSITVKNYLNPGPLFWVFILFTTYLLVALLVLGYFPTFWSQGWKPPTRTENVILLVFIFGSIGIILMLFALFDTKEKKFTKMPIFIKIIAGIMIIGFIGYFTNNIKTAYMDIYLGKAVTYDEEMKERYRLLSVCEEGLCDIPLRLSVYPPTIFTFDLALKPTDEVYWYNMCLRDYIHDTYTPAKRELRD